MTCQCKCAVFLVVCTSLIALVTTFPQNSDNSDFPVVDNVTFESTEGSIDFRVISSIVAVVLVVLLVVAAFLYCLFCCSKDEANNKDDLSNGQESRKNDTKRTPTRNVNQSKGKSKYKKGHYTRSSKKPKANDFLPASLDNAPALPSLKSGKVSQADTTMAPKKLHSTLATRKGSSTNGQSSAKGLSAKDSLAMRSSKHGSSTSASKLKLQNLKKKSKAKSAHSKRAKASKQSTISNLRKNSGHGTSKASKVSKCSGYKQ